MIYQDEISAARQRLGISANFLCELVGINPAKLSLFMTKNQPLPELPQLMETISVLDKLVEDADPYPLAFDDVEVCRKMLARQRAGLRFISVAVGPAEEIADLEAEK